VPQAELHVFYGFENWTHSATVQGDDGQLKLIEAIKYNMKCLESQGVHYRGRIPQQDLACEFTSAGSWLYPTWFTETSCITAMEAQAAGLQIVTSPIAALNETVASRGTLIPGDWMSDAYQDAFVAAAVEALNVAKDDPRRAELSQYARVNFSWDDVAAEWSHLMTSMVSSSTSGTLDFPYQGAVA
jgi:glycosyltransferase involved in cell wall biosynthesis